MLLEKYSLFELKSKNPVDYDVWVHFGRQCYTLLKLIFVLFLMNSAALC